MFALSQNGRQKGHGERTKPEITLYNLKVLVTQKKTLYMQLYQAVTPITLSIAQIPVKFTIKCVLN